MVHDRRIDGQTKVFGNAGALYMNAMTWWDHETRSIWSQPLGQAIEGDLKGVELFLLPSQLTTWSNWARAHPETWLMSNNLQQLTRGSQRFAPDFVIGLLLGEDARAYYYEDIASVGVVNDWLGETPVFIWADGVETTAFIRLVVGQTLTFYREGAELRDEQTNSLWDPSSGLAVGGPLHGLALRQVPSLTAFDWAWADFYPQSGFYVPD